MLVIDPDECIDCGVCVPECPANAILPDDQPEALAWLEHNKTYAALWPLIVEPSSPPPDADEWKDAGNKLALLDPAPASR